MTPLRNTISRRELLGRGVAAAGGVLLAGVPSLAEPPAAAAAADALPTRLLGKTKVPISALTLGTAPCGQSKHVGAREIADLTDVALNLGVTSIDTARAYDDAEEGVGRALGGRRKEVFLATKVWADTIADAEKSFAESLRNLRTDYVDLVYFHGLGTRDVEAARGAEGVFTWLLRQKQLGKTRFVGISGHNLSDRFPAFIATGEVDVVLMVLNFVDRYLYHFEDRVLPLARRHGCGVVAMKVFGGVRGGFGAYAGPKAPPQLDEKLLPLAVRYALSLPGVTSVNIGVHDAEQVRQNVAMVRNFQPLSDAEQQSLAKLGRELSSQWGPHFGPENAPVARAPAFEPIAYA